MTTPARQYSWPPFQPGHELSMTHGAESERKIRPVAERITAELVAAAPWLAAPAFAATLAAVARAEAKVHLLTTWLDEHGLLDGDGVPRPALAALDRAETRATTLRAECGLSPAAWARLRRDLTADPDGGTAGAEALRALGRQLLESTAAEAPVLPAPAPSSQQGEHGGEEEAGDELGKDGGEEAGHHQPPPALHGGAS